MLRPAYPMPMQAFKKSSIRDEFSNFFTETSFTAVVKIYNAKNWVKRLTWTLLVLAMVSWLVVQCYWLLIKYFQYPIEVKIDLKGAVALDFPSVTFCNLNPIRESALDDPRYADLQAYKTPPTEDSLYTSIQDNFVFSDICNQTTQFQCANGQCIMKDWRCDGYDDCFQKDDEDNCDNYNGTTGVLNSISSILGLLGSTTSPFGMGPTSSGLRPTSFGMGTTTSGLTGKRRKREADSHEAEPGRGRQNFFKRMKRALDRMQTKVNDGEISRDNYKHFIGRQKRYLEKWRENTAEISRRKAILSERGRRSKRSASGSSSGESREKIDWTTLLGNTTFNKWDQLETSNKSWEFYDSEDDEYAAAMTYAYVTALVGASDAEEGGHQKKDFIASCKFNGRQCSPSNFTYFHSYKYGNCFTFNAKDHNRDLVTNFPGPSAGLRVELFVNQNEYVPNLAAEAGVRVSVHPKGSKPFPEDEGLSVAPKTSTSIGLKQVVIERLPAPHGICQNFGHIVNYYQRDENFTYTKLSCSKSCYQDIIREACECVSPLLYIIPGETICNMSDPVKEKCVRDLIKTHIDKYHSCDEKCPPPCYESRYDSSFSMASWPSKKYEGFFQSRVGKTNSKYLTVDDIENHFSRVQVYFEDFIYQHIQQQKAYESMNLISDLGGQLGLWLGLSAITIGEICSFLFHIGRSLPNSLSRKKEKQEDGKTKHKIAPVTLEEMYEDIAKDGAKDIIPPAIAKPKSQYFKE